MANKIPSIIKHDNKTIELRFMHDEIPHGISLNINNDEALIMGIIYYYKLDANTENAENVTSILDGIIIYNRHLNYKDIDPDKLSEHIRSQISYILELIGKTRYANSLNRIVGKFIEGCIEIINKI